MRTAWVSDRITTLGQTDDPDPISTCQGNNCSFYGIPVNTNSVQLVVDGSGSMSACVAWGNTRSSTIRLR